MASRYLSGETNSWWTSWDANGLDYPSPVALDGGCERVELNDLGGFVDQQLHADETFRSDLHDWVLLAVVGQDIGCRNTFREDLDVAKLRDSGEPHRQVLVNGIDPSDRMRLSDALAVEEGVFGHCFSPEAYRPICTNKVVPSSVSHCGGSEGESAGKMTDSKAFLDERRRARRFFNRMSPLYPIIERHLFPQYRDVLDRLALPPELSVLDLATGTGLLAGAFAERGHAVVGLDFADKLLNRARQRFPQPRSPTPRSDRIRRLQPQTT